MKNVVKYLVLSVLLMSFSAAGFAVDEKKEECPVGQVFDKEKGVCVIKEVVPAAEIKVEVVPVSK